jgi:hypothetical protein
VAAWVNEFQCAVTKPGSITQPPRTSSAPVITGSTSRISGLVPVVSASGSGSRWNRCPADEARRSGRQHARETVPATAQETVLTTAQETVLTTASSDRALASRSTFPITW